jgi:phenylacetate-CoA ligase
MINFRKAIFNLKDSINGGSIANHIKDLNFILSDTQSEASKNKIDARRRELLQYALNNVPYYKNKISPSRVVVLESFPVINKNIIRDNVTDFTALGYDIKTLSKAVTSGSTGTPFFVYHDANKKARNTADTIYFGDRAGFTIGTNLYYLKIWTAVNKKNKFSALAENVAPIDVTQLSDENIEKLVVSINQNKFKK